MAFLSKWKLFYPFDHREETPTRLYELEHNIIYRIYFTLIGQEGILNKAIAYSIMA